MVGIDHVLEMLQPVARRDDDAAAADRGIVGLDELARPHHLEALVARQHRLLLGWAEIGEDQAVALLDRIAGLAHALALRAGRVGLAGHLQAVAFDVEQPAVIAAADAALLDLAVVQSRAAMAAARIDQARSPLPVTEQDQLLAQHLHRPRHRTCIGAHAHRMPVAAQKLAHRRAATDLGQLGVVGRRLERVGGADVGLAHGYSTLAPDWRISSAQIGVSRASTSASSLGVEPTGVCPWAIIFSATAGSLITALISRDMRSTISAGVPAGA